jgi:hypothetical protein
VRRARIATSGTIAWFRLAIGARSILLPIAALQTVFAAPYP